MKKCSNCGAGNLDEAKFCHQCGSLIARERPMSAKDMATEKKRPSLDDLEFVETNLTHDNPKTLKMKDKVTLHSTEKEQVSPAMDQQASQRKHKRMPEIGQTMGQEEPKFVDSLASVKSSTRLADTGDVFIAEVLANLDTDIDLDADIVDWPRDEGEAVDPESLAIPVEQAGKQRSTQASLKDSADKLANRFFKRDKAEAVQAEATSPEPDDVVSGNVEPDDVEFDDDQQVASLQETDLVEPAEPLRKASQPLEAADQQAQAVMPAEDIKQDEVKPAEAQSVTPTEAPGENPLFKREPVYLKPETYGPSEREAQHKLDEELAGVVSTIECPHCGHQNPDYYSFCQVCKKKLYDYDHQVVDTLGGISNDASDQTHSSNDDVLADEEDLFVPANIGTQSQTEATGHSKHKKKKQHKTARKRSYGWLITLLLAILFIASLVFAYFYFFASDTAEAVYQDYSQAIVSQDYDKAASLTASVNGPAWTGDDVAQMLANYSEAQVDLSALLAANPDATELSQGNHLILEVDTEPSFLGLFPNYQVVVQTINVALSVPNDYRDIAITTLSHQAQPITAGEAVILQPRENYIIVRLTEDGETREIGLDLNYSLMAEGTLPISLKEVENRIQADLTTLPGAYPQDFKTTGFVIDGQEYTADIITLNGYVGQSFTVSIRGEYFGETVESAQQEIHLEDDKQVLVSLAEDTDLLDKLQAIESANQATIANRTPDESAETWLQSFQNDFIDAINFRAPDMLAKYGTESDWYTNTTNWIQNDVVTNGIYYNTGTYEIASVEQNENGQMVLTTTELYDYTLGGVAAVQAQSKVYVLADNGGQLTIVSVEAQDIAN